MFKMKRIVALILVVMMLLISCGEVKDNTGTTTPPDNSVNTDIPNPSEPSDPNPSDPDNSGSGCEDDNHSYQTSVTEPTCGGEGYTTHTCSECGHSYATDTVAPLGHTYAESVVAPTCVADGYTVYTCSTCNFSYVENKVAALGHSYKATVTTPTCESHGYTTYVCEICNDSYVADDVDSSGHGYTSVVTKPTCVSDGYTTHTCTSCGDSFVSNKVAALGHSYNQTVTEPTCENQGYTTYNCSACGDSYVSDVVEALGHSITGTVTAPTCQSTGYTTYVCVICDYSYVADQTAALDHIWEEATTEAPKTCKTCGTTVGDKLPGTSTDSGSSSGGSSSGSTETTYADTLYVSYINVGQGDSIFIQVADCDILIDAGESSYGSIVSSYLKGKNVDDIELLINTHPDSDHCGGLTTVLNSFVVEEVWASAFTKTTTAYKNFKSAVSNEGLSMKTPSVGTVFTYEYLTLTVLYNGSGASNSNDSSIVVMLEYGSFRFLFTGDISSTIESKLVSNSSVDLSCDVLKVPHHGSAGSSSSSFLRETGAEYGVICVGNNSYGHPTSTALNNLSSAGISVYRTDKNGNVMFSTNGSTLYLPNGSTDTTGSGSGVISGGSTSGGSSSGSTSGGSSSGSTSGGSSSSGSSDSTQYFIGNTETKVFHLPTCSNLPAASKQNTMYNYWWIINIAGYTPCGRCLKNYSGGVTYIANTESKVYHLSTCSYLPAASKQKVITSTSGYTPCGHCIK